MTRHRLMSSVRRAAILNGQHPSKPPPRRPRVLRPADTDWMLRAACRGLHSTDEEHDVMFPRSEQVGQDLRRAKRVCLRCPVREDCLTQAVAAREGAGVWGGLSPTERREYGRGAPVRSCRCGLLFAAPVSVLVCSACRMSYRPGREAVS